MTTTVTDGAISTASWKEPRGLNPRGTVVVVASDGEPPQVYARLGARLAADAYRVVVISSDDPLAAGTAEAVAAVLNADDVVGPTVLIGSHAGAVAVRALAAGPMVDPAAVVLAGYPIGAGVRDENWQSEIEARTTCPTHRHVLREHARPARSEPVAAVDAPLTMPALAVHGSADTIAPLEAALAEYTNAGVTRAVIVDGGQHDILNDITHRSVAAALVQFLEQVRSGGTVLRTVDLPAS